ncbi:Gp15 [uncultured Mycobacterium sp.]|uniref:Gp15 n=1 Tax=uncultured Mycobacterium sp. TaxID=171292 RepID=A0A1Y5P8D4_9MYCO|nr:Gp15 [uncultured Mycobacterium sp.]
MVDNLPTVRIPAGPITKHGAWSVLKGDKPLMWLTSPDVSVLINLMGGIARANPTLPESVQIKELKALGASWKVIRQKGATQDGETFIDALYDAAEPTMKVIVRGRDAAHTRRTQERFTGSLDAIKQSQLNFWTNELGRWWADIRMVKAIPDAVSASPTSQELSIMLGIDDAFWESEPHVTSFEFEYDDVKDAFTTTYTTDIGPNWPLYYTGEGAGYLRTFNSAAMWHDDPGLDNYTRELVCGPYKDFETAGDNQVVSMQLGSVPELSFGVPGYAPGANDLWARMGRDGSGDWDGNGIRARIAMGAVKLSGFVDFVEVWTRLLLAGTPEHPLPIIPFTGDNWRLVAGTEGNPRLYRLYRNGGLALSYKETTDAPTNLGADYRGIGFGVRAGGALLTQASPASVRNVSAGDNATIDQSGYLDFVNNGDQPGYADITVFGPASSVKIWNGPGADVNEYVEIKNVLPNQVFFIRTDPRRKIIQDLSSVAPTPQELDIFQEAANSFLNFATARGALRDQLKSAFGINPPQGNVETLVKGRFTDDCGIPAKSPGKPAEKHLIKVTIDGGNAQSQIVASLTPRRRSPI